MSFFYYVIAVASAVTHERVQKSLVGEALEQGRGRFVAGDDRRYLARDAYACELLGYDADPAAPPPRARTWRSNRSRSGTTRRCGAAGRDTGTTALRRQGRPRAGDALPRLPATGRRDAGLHRDLLAGGVS